MSFTSIVMMVIALVVLWGGLALSLIHLHKHPDEE
ncbi:methionine/alanine import family NSS transporter small subunit [Rhodococcus sp. NPDC058521]